MSMNTRIIGLRNPEGAQHQKMLTAAEALYNAGIHELPQQLKDYFDVIETGEVVSDPMSGCAVDLDGCFSRGEGRESCDDWIVDLKTLPEGVTHIRFTNSY